MTMAKISWPAAQVPSNYFEAVEFVMHHTKPIVDQIINLLYIYIYMLPWQLCIFSKFLALEICGVDSKIKSETSKKMLWTKQTRQIVFLPFSIPKCSKRKDWQTATILSALTILQSSECRVSSGQNKMSKLPAFNLIRHQADEKN